MAIGGCTSSAAIFLRFVPLPPVAPMCNPAIAERCFWLGALLREPRFVWKTRLDSCPMVPCPGKTRIGTDGEVEKETRYVLNIAVFHKIAPVVVALWVMVVVSFCGWCRSRVRNPRCLSTMFVLHVAPRIRRMIVC